MNTFQWTQLPTKSLQKLQRATAILSLKHLLIKPVLFAIEPEHERDGRGVPGE
jgi:hypothetical protein